MTAPRTAYVEPRVGRFALRAVDRMLDDWYGIDAERRDLLCALAWSLGIQNPKSMSLGELAEAITRRRTFCRECGCTEAVACAGGCGWGSPDLCTQCVDVGEDDDT